MGCRSSRVGRACCAAIRPRCSTRPASRTRAGAARTMGDATVRVRSGSGLGGLEVWALGTPAELDALQGALAGVGSIAWQGMGGVAGRRERLTGGDLGRFRAYLRVLVRTAAPGGVR